MELLILVSLLAIAAIAVLAYKVFSGAKDPYDAPYNPSPEDDVTPRDVDTNDRR